MPNATLVIAFLAAITLLAGVAARSGTPYPVVLVLGGLAMGLFPGVPSPALQPELVLVLFLPPLLYSAAYLSYVHELRAAVWPILGLAIGLVLATVGAVALVARMVVGLPWSVAFVLGAVVGPTDPVSATAILRRLGTPQRIVTTLEGESLVNDATAITVYTIAIAAVSTGRFSIPHAVGDFAYEVVAGSAIGVAVAAVMIWLRTGFAESAVQLAFALLTPFVAYVPANEAGASGVLAVVGAGLYAGLRLQRTAVATTRLELAAFWRLFVFLLNAVLFLLVGTQLPHVLDDIRGGVSWQLIGKAFLLAAAVIAVRTAWMFIVPLVTSALHRGEGGTHASTGAKLVLGWNGVRGAVSLAIALAIPFDASRGRPFPDRGSLIFFAYLVVLITLVPPGFTLGPLIRLLGLQQHALQRRQLAEVQARLAHAAREEIEELVAGAEVSDSTADRLRGLYEARLARLTALVDNDGSTDAVGEVTHYLEVSMAAIDAQRRELLELRRARTYPAAVLGEAEHQIDLEEARLPRRSDQRRAWLPTRRQAH